MKQLSRLILICLFFSMFSCQNFVEDLNDDPNRPLSSDAVNTLQGVLLANQFWLNGDATRIAMIWMNQATGSDRQYIALNNWNNITASDFNTAWGFAYASVITNSRIASKQALEGNNRVLQGVYQVLEAHAAGTAASLWGDVPFTEVNTGVENPAYEPQADVYTKVQTLLDNAITNLSSGTGQIPSAKDIAFQADAAKWIKLAHALKARFYLHVKNYAMALTEANLGMSTAADDYKGHFGTTYGSNMNPFYSFMVFDREGYMDAQNAYGQDLLNPSNSKYRGNSKTNETARFNFSYSSNSPNTSSSPAEGKFSRSITMPLVTLGEMQLIIAETQARLNGLSAGVTAYNTYRQNLNTGYSIGRNNNGYGTAPFSYQPYVDADFQNGGLENADNITPVNAFLREIYQERYVYFIGHFESFTDFGRTNNIAEIELKSGFNGSPQRLLYPQSEINSNTSLTSVPPVTEPTPVNK